MNMLPYLVVGLERTDIRLPQPTSRGKKQLDRRIREFLFFGVHVLHAQSDVSREQSSIRNRQLVRDSPLVRGILAFAFLLQEILLRRRQLGRGEQTSPDSSGLATAKPLPRRGMELTPSGFLYLAPKGRVLTQSAICL